MGSPRSVRPGLVAVALLAMVVSLPLGITGLRRLRVAGALPTQTRSYPVEVGSSKDAAECAAILEQRLEGLGPMLIDGAQNGLVVIRVQYDRQEIVPALLTAATPSNLPSHDLPEDLSAEVEARVEAHPLEETLSLFEPSEAPPVVNPGPLARTGWGYLLIGISLMGLGLVVLVRSRAR